MRSIRLRFLAVGAGAAAAVGVSLAACSTPSSPAPAQHQLHAACTTKDDRQGHYNAVGICEPSTGTGGSSSPSSPTLAPPPASPAPAPPSPEPGATHANGTACTTTQGYYPGGQPGHWDSATSVCVPNGEPPENPTPPPQQGDPNVGQGYLGDVNGGGTQNPCNYSSNASLGDCAPGGTGQYSQTCVDQYGPQFPYLVGNHCEASPSGGNP